MGWLVKADKPDFIGRDASAARRRRRGPRQVLTGFEIVGTATCPPRAPRSSATARRRPRDERKWSPTLDRAIGLAWLPAEEAVEGRR